MTIRNKFNPDRACDSGWRRCLGNRRPAPAAAGTTTAGVTAANTFLGTLGRSRARGTPSFPFYRPAAHKLVVTFPMGSTNVGTACGWAI